MLPMLSGIATAGEVELVVSIAPVADSVTVSAEAVATESLQATGEVVIRRAGPTGTTNSRQVVEVDLEAGERQTLAVFSTNLPAGHTIEVSAVLRSGNRVLKKVTATYP